MELVDNAPLLALAQACLRPAETSADFQFHYGVDQFKALGLGENIPIVTGTSSDSLRAFNTSVHNATRDRKSPYAMPSKIVFDNR